MHMVTYFFASEAKVGTLVKSMVQRIEQVTVEQEYSCAPYCKSDGRYSSGQGKCFRRFPKDSNRKKL